VTWSDIIYRSGMALAVVALVYAFWNFYALLLPRGGIDEEVITRLVEQRTWAGVEATGVAALCYAVTRSVLYLSTWFKGDNSS
jgi:hypothetical protein